MVEEKEIKILLSEGEYKKVATLFRWDKEYLQTNYYYRNSEAVEKCKDEITIRIREKNEKLLLQVKIPELKKELLHIKKEYEEEINNIPDYISKVKLKQLTGYTFKQDVNLFGKLTTLRRESQMFDDFLICLDRNSYFDKTDYELEIEFEREYPHRILRMLEDIGIETNRESIGKFSRFIKNYMSGK